MSTRDDVVLLVSLTVFVLWQPAKRSSGGKNDRVWFDRNRSEIRCAPPGFVFGIAWTVLFGLIIAAGFVFFRDFQGSCCYLAFSVIYIANVLLSKAWSVAFFDRENTAVALLIAIAMFISGVVELVLLIIMRAWIPFGLLVPYVVWVLFAIYLNYQWNSKGLPTVGKTPAPSSLPLPATTNRQTSYQPRPIVKYAVKKKLPRPGTQRPLMTKNREAK
jgi:translocator protein